MKDNAQRLAEMKRYLEWMEAKKAQSERLHDEFQAAGQTHDHHLKLWRAELSRKFRYMAVTAVICISGVILGAFLGIPDSASFRS